MVPTGQAINVTEHKPGSISDFNIFCQNLDFYNQSLTKMVMKMKSPTKCCCWQNNQKIKLYLRTKDIKVLSRMFEQLFPRKKLAGNYYLLMMNIGMQQFQVIVLLLRIFWSSHKTVGCYFNKTQWIKEGYNDNFHLCVALNNFHISFNPLCDEEDAAHYIQQS